MAEFEPAFERALLAEGGFKLHKVAGDSGGLTYAGIARKHNPQWLGWNWIDRGETPPTQLVRDFYRAGWWRPLGCDHLLDQEVATSIYSFGTNTSAYGRPTVAAKLAQVVVGVVPDGVVGPKTIAAINATDPKLFLAKFALARVARYAAICNRDRSQSKFLLGWVNRTLKESGT